jgi:hypothetical protein
MASSLNQTNFLYQTLVYSFTIPLFVVTTLGNAVILITIKFQARLLSSNSNYFILSLALADFFVGIAIMPIMIIYTANHGQWVYTQIVCDIWMASDFLCSSASFLTLSAMSIERYKMLTTSYLHIKNSSKLRIIVFICLSWLLPFLTWIPVIIGFRISTSPSNPGECSVPANKYLILLMSIFLYHIPLLCMVIFYTKLIIHIRKSSTNRFDLHEHGLSCKKYTKSELLKLNRNNSWKFLRKNSTCNVEIHERSDLIANKNKFDFNAILNLNQNNNRLLEQSNNPPSITKSSESQKPMLSKLRLLLSCCCIWIWNESSEDKKRDNINPLNLNETQVDLINKNNKRKTNLPDLNSTASNNKVKFERKKREYNSSLTQKSNSKVMENNNECDACNIKRKLESPNFHGERNVNTKNKNLTIEKKHSIKLKRESFTLIENVDYHSVRLKRNRKAARMLGLLVAAFLISWLPFSIIYPLGYFYPQMFPNYLNIIVWWFGYFNSTINPFLYVYSNKNIR